MGLEKLVGEAVFNGSSVETTKTNHGPLNYLIRKSTGAFKKFSTMAFKKFAGLLTLGAFAFTASPAYAQDCIVDLLRVDTLASVQKERSPIMKEVYCIGLNDNYSGPPDTNPKSQDRLHTIYAQQRFGTRDTNPESQEYLEEQAAPKKENLPPKEVDRFMGHLLMQGGYSAEDFPIGKYEGNPYSVNVSLGYNILGSDRTTGVLLFPNVRAGLNKNRPVYYWDNQAEASVGAIFQKLPFTVGIEFGFREPFEKTPEDEKGPFYRAWANYWGEWHAKNAKRLWGTQYFEIRYDSLYKNVFVDGRADINYNIFQLAGVTFSPFAAGTFNYDTADEPWNRFLQGSGGLKLIKGGLQLTIEAGHRHSFNKGGYEGPFYKCILSTWIPLDFSSHHKAK